MRMFNKIRDGQNRTIIIFGFIKIRYKRKISIKKLERENALLKEQLEYIKEHTDISMLKPATGELRTQQLQLVKFAEEFFNEIKDLNIKPFLLCGNLLGHVRHNGFIPWDDDLDFGLMRADYEKLIEYCKKHFVVCEYDGKLSEYSDTKVYERLHKRCTEHPNQYVLEIWCNQLQLIKGTSVNDCCFIDFWSFDYFDDTYSFEEHKKYLAANKEKIHSIDTVNKITNYVRSEIKNNKHIVKQSNQLYFGIDCAMSYTKNNATFISKDVIFPLKKIPYEGASFFVPNKSEEYLTFEFKDYMSWPKDIGNSYHNVGRDLFIAQLNEYGDKK